MKVTKFAVPICVVSMVVSLACVGFMIWGATPQEVANEAAERALQKREKELVLKVKPRFLRMFDGQDLKSVDQNWNPETLEELSEPLFEMINSLESE